MRKVTEITAAAFERGDRASVGNTKTDGRGLYLHGNKIAEWRGEALDQLWITNAGWSSNTTKERLNGLDGVSITQKNWQWYLNGKEWDGQWIQISGPVAAEGSQPAENRDPGGLKSIAMVAMLGDMFGKTQKESNDWKTRMLKAGLEGRGLIMPEDWDQLPEAEKQKRLDGAISAIA